MSKRTKNYLKFALGSTMVIYFIIDLAADKIGKSVANHIKN